MKVQADAIREIEEYAKAFYEDIKKQESKEVIVFYVGDLNSGYTNAISSKLEQLVESKITDKQARKRFYSSYIEAIQNIRIHALKDTDDMVPGAVTIYTTDKKLCGTFLNFIDKEKGERLINRYDQINSLDRKKLKEIYMDQMVNGTFSTKGGAGLGIITIVLRSQNPSVAKIIDGKGNYDIFKSSLFVDFKS